MDKDLTITELESCLNVTQFLIDKILTEAKMNNPNYDLEANTKLKVLNKYQTKIINEIKEKLDENFS